MQRRSWSCVRPSRRAQEEEHNSGPGSGGGSSADAVTKALATKNTSYIFNLRTHLPAQAPCAHLMGAHGGYANSALCTSQSSPCVECPCMPIVTVPDEPLATVS